MHEGIINNQKGTKPRYQEDFNGPSQLLNLQWGGDGWVMILSRLAGFLMVYCSMINH